MKIWFVEYGLLLCLWPALYRTSTAHLENSPKFFSDLVVSNKALLIYDHNIQ